MYNAATERLGINAVAHHTLFAIRLLAMHFGVNAVAGSVRQNFQCFVQTYLFHRGDVGAIGQAFAFLDDDTEEILFSRINVYNTAQLARFQTF
jgi:hypothetical protein